MHRVSEQWIWNKDVLRGGLDQYSRTVPLSSVMYESTRFSKLVNCDIQTGEVHAKASYTELNNRAEQ